MERNNSSFFFFSFVRMGEKGEVEVFNCVLFFMKGNIWINNLLLKADTQTELFLYWEMS